MDLNLSFNGFWKEHIKPTGVKFHIWLNTEMQDYYKKVVKDKTVPFEVWKKNLTDGTREEIKVWLIKDYATKKDKQKHWENKMNKTINAIGDIANEGDPNEVIKMIERMAKPEVTETTAPASPSATPLVKQAFWAKKIKGTTITYKLAGITTGAVIFTTIAVVMAIRMNKKK